MRNVRNVQMEKIGDRYYLDGREFNADDPVAIYPEVEKVGRKLTDDIMRATDQSWHEYARDADIDPDRFRAWWSGEFASQLTARDIYQLDRLNAQYAGGMVRDHQAELEWQEQVKREAQAQKQERNANLQEDYDRQQRWEQIYKNAGPAPKPQLDSWQQARIAELQELAKRPPDNEHDQRERDELTQALRQAGF